MAKYLKCMYQGYRCLSVLNVMLLCLTLWLGGVCTDNDTKDDDEANDGDTQGMIESLSVDKPNEKLPSPVKGLPICSLLWNL